MVKFVEHRYKSFSLTGLDALDEAVDGEERGPISLNRIILDRGEYSVEISAFLCKAT